MQFYFSSHQRRPFSLLYPILLVLGLILLPAALWGQHTGELDDIGAVTRTFVIRNVRVVQAPGRTLERATVVIRRGLIVEVGTNVTIPPDAEVIEGDSLTVYAGFIDGLSTAGVEMPKPPENLPKVPRPGAPPNDRAGIQPERDVRTFLNPTNASIDSFRMAGFTVAQVVPTGGMLPGSGGIILLGGSSVNDMVIRDDASLYARFEPADDIYPATTMAIMARWRGLYREADARKRLLSSYSETPGGMERPRVDRTLEAFFSVIDRRKPVLFNLDGPLDVDRALHLRRDLGFNLVIAGLKDARDVVDRLAADAIPVFLSLDLPREPDASDTAGGKSGKDSLAAKSDSLLVTAPNTTSPTLLTKFDERRTADFKDIANELARLKVLQESTRRNIYASASALRGRNVKFGFATYGTSVGALRSNIRLMVQNGLPEDAALAALTIDGARLLGLDKSLGTVERGKVANLVVTRGSYFDEKSIVRYVFVDGVRYEYNKDPIAKKDSGKGDGAPKVVSPGGVTGDSLVVNNVLRARHDGRARGNVLIKNGTVMTVTNGTLEGTDVLIRDGKIVQIGKGLSPPSGGVTIDATGKYVIPGIIDAHSHIGISDVNEWTNPVTAEVAVGDVIDPYEIAIYRALAGGVTVSHAMHGSANVIGGQCQTLKHRYGTVDPSALIMEGAPRTIKFALGENPTRVHGRGFGVQPATRMGVEQVMRRAFSEARNYMQAKENYAKSSNGSTRILPPEYDLRLETLAAILRGEIIVHCHSYRADEILMVMRVFRDFGIKRLVFQHVNEGFKIAPELAEFGAMASVFSDWWSYKFEVYYSTAYNAAILTRNGVVTSINSDSPELNRHLYHEASKTMRYGGLSADEALRLITINPARQLGIESRVGSLEVGKDGDVAIFSAPPTSIYAICETTIVDGVVRFDRATDPDDMRLVVDPSEPVETTIIDNGEDDGCMQGTEHLFQGK